MSDSAWEDKSVYDSGLEPLSAPVAQRPQLQPRVTSNLPLNGRGSLSESLVFLFIIEHLF